MAFSLCVVPSNWYSGILRIAMYSCILPSVQKSQTGKSLDLTSICASCLKELYNTQQSEWIWRSSNQSSDEKVKSDQEYVFTFCDLEYEVQRLFRELLRLQHMPNLLLFPIASACNVYCRCLHTRPFLTLHAESGKEMYWKIHIN